MIRFCYFVLGLLLSIFAALVIRETLRDSSDAPFTYLLAFHSFACAAAFFWAAKVDFRGGLWLIFAIALFEIAGTCIVMEFYLLLQRHVKLSGFVLAAAAASSVGGLGFVRLARMKNSRIY